MEDFDTETIFSNWVQIDDDDENSKTWSNSATTPRRLTPETRAVMEEGNPIVKKNCTNFCRILFFFGATILPEFPEFIKNSENIRNVSRGRIIELSGSCGCSKASERHKLLLMETQKIRLGFKETLPPLPLQIP
jgi:hypothetical protein